MESGRNKRSSYDSSNSTRARLQKMPSSRISGQVGKLYSHMRDVNGVLTKYTLAEWLYAAPETVMQYVRDGRLQVYRPGRNPVCLLEDVITFVIANPEQD